MIGRWFERERGEGRESILDRSMAQRDCERLRMISEVWRGETSGLSFGAEVILGAMRAHFARDGRLPHVLIEHRRRVGWTIAVPGDRWNLLLGSVSAQFGLKRWYWTRRGAQRAADRICVALSVPVYYAVTPTRHEAL